MLAGGEEHSLELIDSADGQTEPEGICLAEEGDLLHMALDMPFGMRTVAMNESFRVGSR